MNLKAYLTTLLIITTVAAVHAQDSKSKKQLPAAAPKGSSSLRSGLAATELMERNFFAPELVMQHQKAIELTAGQQDSIRADMQKMIARFTELQWQQSAENEALLTLVAKERPDEKEVLAQLDKLLATENEIKRVHAGLLVRIKNSLTTEQQARLRQLAAAKYPGAKTPETKAVK